MASASFSLEQLEKFAEQFANDFLSEYCEYIEKTKVSTSRKEVNDPLWGTISLTPLEVSIIDSPLIQRLRYVRQLGVVHWVYPGAIHTRFEHTLGVLYQVQSLISAINALGSYHGQDQIIDEPQREILRLCALFHDIGHPAFSHVSEFAIQWQLQSNAISVEFSRLHRAEERKLSEIFAYFVMRSAAIRRMFEILFSRHEKIPRIDSDFTKNIERVLEKVADAIVGKKIDDRLPLLHEIISGPFDADKLDYFVRDARMAGTPAVLDISRLVQKITIRRLSTSELPREIARNVKKNDSYILFGMKWSGLMVLDELHLARILLYKKIYQHPKVTAVEQMVQTAVSALTTIAPIASVLRLIYYNNDDALLQASEKQLATELFGNAEYDIEVAKTLRGVGKILSNLRLRRLWVKAYLIQERFPSDPLELSDPQKNGLIDFREAIEQPQSRDDFRVLLIEEVRKIFESTSQGQLIDTKELEASIAISVLGRTPGGSQIARALLLPGSSAPVYYRDYTANRTSWADTYMADSPTGYIFSSPELADAVYIAVEKLLREKYGVKLPPSALEASKRNEAEIDQLKRSVSAAGYYKSAPFDIRPFPARLQMADVSAIVDDVVSRLSSYQDPKTPPKSHEEWVTRVYGWLRQFENDDYITCALHLLGRLRMIDRSDTVAALKKFIQEFPEFQGANVVPFGTARDSSAIQTYFSADLIGTHIRACTTLHELAGSSDKSPIIFIDDFIGSGGQGQDILAAGFGVSELRKDLKEQRELFEEPVQEYLRSARVAFVFTAAWDEGISNLERVSKKLGLNAEFFRYISESEIPFAFENANFEVGDLVASSFRDYCRHVGSSLLSGPNTVSTQRDNSEKVGDRSLGYGNRAMLLASPFNVPTQTLTLMWSEGFVDGAKWTPLLSRRKKV